MREIIQLVFKDLQMKDDLCGALIGSSNNYDGLTNSDTDPLLGIPQGPRPWLQREVQSFVLGYFRQKSFGTQSTCCWSGFLKQSKHFAFGEHFLTTQRPCSPSLTPIR